MSTPLPDFDMGAALAGRLPAKHPDFGPFGDQADLDAAVELLGPLHDLKRNGIINAPGDLTMTRQALPALLWTIGQRFNEAQAHDKSFGSWEEHQTRMDNTWKAASDLIKAIDRLQSWERKTLGMGADIDLERLNLKLKHVEAVSKSCAKESTTGNTTPHKFMHGSPKARLAWTLFRVWSQAPKAPKASRDGLFLDFVNAVARFAVRPGTRARDLAMDRAVKDALSPSQRKPRSLLHGDSPYMGWNWDEAVGQKEG